MILKQVYWRQSVLFLLAVVTGVSGATEARQDPARLSLTDSDIARRYQERREAVLAASIATIGADPAKGGSLVDVGAALQRGQKQKEAWARLAKINEPVPVAAMFWMYPMVTTMVGGHEHLDAASWARIQELWRTYWPARGDTENHWVLFYSSLYLAAQTWPEAGPEQWFNGKSSAENMADARAYIEHWMGIATAHGQGEFDSPSYIQEYLIPLGLLAGWTQDAAFRQKARMMLDYIIYDYAVETVDGWYGGAHSRVYPKQIITQGRAPIEGISWLLFGFGDYVADPASTILAMSGYTPPPILERVARTRDQPYVERELKRTRWRERNAGPESFLIYDRRTAPVYKYSYVDRDFVLGSSQGGLLQPIQQQTWSLMWRTDKKRLDAANTFFGLQPYSSPYEGTMYFGGDYDTVTALIIRSKADYDTEDKLPGGSPHEQVFQQGTALIALYDMPADNRFPLITTLFTRDLTHTVEDASGWIFTQGGPVYIAYRPLAPGVWKPNDWTGLLKGGAGGAFLSGGFNEWGVGHKCYVSTALRNGYVVQVAPVRDFKSINDFKAAIRALPLKFSTDPKPEVTFTALDGSVLHARYGDVPSVGGVPVDYAHWPMFDSPFAHEERETQRLEIHHGDQSYLLDFKKEFSLEAKSAAVASAMADKMADRSASAPVASAGTPSTHRMYVSASMTKLQVNSPTPADFGLFYRADDGKWLPFGPRVGISGLTVAPGDSSVMLVPSADGVVRSRDGGKTWRQVTGWDVADVRSIVFDPENPSLVYAATQWGPIRSTDGGESWQPAQQGLAKYYCQTILADPLHTGRVLLGTEDGIYVSTDAAQSWTRVESPATTILRLVRSGADAQLLLAGTLKHGAWLSRDNGATWAAVDAGSAKANLYAAALNPKDAAIMAVGGWGAGVRVSDDGGATWADRSAGLPVKNVLVLAFDPDTKGRLWAATFEEGSFYSDDLGRTWKNGGLYGANGTDYIFVPAPRR